MCFAWGRNKGYVFFALALWVSFGLVSPAASPQPLYVVSPAVPPTYRLHLAQLLSQS